ncbi:MAG: glycosyltransferase family 8 protein [Fibrobacter sp.]|nr:glycosyltransferase family 8 protein [Fibrobacter sp.]
MNIVVASDQNYVPHLETLIVSIAENNVDIDEIKITILDSGILENSKEKILCYASLYPNIEFTFFSISENYIASRLGGNVSKDRCLATFARIFIPEILTNERRAFYFDVDAIVQDNLKEVYEASLNEYAIAGVCDVNPIQRHINVGLTKEQTYINAGMILWNLDYCREINFTQQCIDFVKERKGIVDAMDQGTINGVLGKQNLIKILPPKYNVFTALFQLNKKQIKKIYGLPNYYSDNEILEARTSPVFVHFTPNMTTRPWVKNCKHPLKNVYWKYREKTHNNKFQLEKDKRRLKLKLLGFLYRNHSSFFAFILGAKQ